MGDNNKLMCLAAPANANSFAYKPELLLKPDDYRYQRLTETLSTFPLDLVKIVNQYANELSAPMYTLFQHFKHPAKNLLYCEYEKLLVMLYDEAHPERRKKIIFHLEALEQLSRLPHSGDLYPHFIEVITQLAAAKLSWLDKKATNPLPLLEDLFTALAKIEKPKSVVKSKL